MQTVAFCDLLSCLGICVFVLTKAIAASRRKRLEVKVTLIKVVSVRGMSNHPAAIGAGCSASV
jgi:hypothetical protein